MIKGSNSRRDFIRNAAYITGSAFVLSGCSGITASGNMQNNTRPVEKNEEDDKEVTAVEDLMREHGILRRALLVYGEAAVRLHKDPNSVPPDALQKTAKLFRTFGEDYHEKQLEETYIFPRLKQVGNDAAVMSDILLEQHQRGREITDYIIAVTSAGKIGANAPVLADTLYNFVRMYAHHAAREDTILFPAWKESVSDSEFDDLREKFEDIEDAQFGEDGFENAEQQISDIESSMGLGDLSQLTAPPPLAQ